MGEEVEISLNERSVSRHENKFIVSTYTTELLRRRLPAILKRDAHAGPDGSYFIRSVYFDDVDYSAYREKLHGVQDRTKFRLRYYNYDDSTIFLEKKIKQGDLTGKESAKITRAEADALLYCDDLSWCSRDPLLTEFARARRAGSRPAVVVDYDRCAFTHWVEDVRVTLDRNIRTCPYQPELFNANLLTVPAMEPGEQVLEIKYNAFLPAHVAIALEGVPKQRMAVSKFVKCLSILE